MRLSAALLIIVIVVLYCGGAVASILTKRPWVDEAWFTGPALDLVTRGKMGTLLLDQAGSHLRLYSPKAVLSGIGEHTYWVMPLYFLQLALWGKIFGFSIFSIRIPSALWGIVAVLSTGIFIRRLYPTGGTSTALVGMAILAADFGFLDSASNGRMDMMCAALGLAALAVYLSLRERSLLAAIILSHLLATTACLTHPNGVFGSVTLILAMIWLDRKKIGLITIGMILLPYAFGVLCWAIYCAQAPADFVAQFSANVASKMDHLTPWNAVRLEITDRYKIHYWPEGGMAKIKIVGLLLTLGAILTLTTNWTLQKTGCKLLVLLTALRFLMLAMSGGPKFEYYFVQILPYFAGLIAVAFWHFWSSRHPALRILCTSALISYFGVQLVVLAHLVTSVRGYQTEYMPVVKYLQSAIRPGDAVVGSAELGFALGFYNPQLKDDVWLGYWTRQQPSIVVTDQWYYEPVISAATQRSLPTQGYFASFLTEQFELVKQTRGYRVYRRRVGPPASF